MARAKRLARMLVPRKVRNWLRSPAGSMRWAWAQARYLGGANDIVQIRPGWSLVCHPAAREFAYSAQQNDPDQIVEFDSFVQQLAPDAVLFDLGAHFGLFSLAALHYGGPGAVAVAVDPSPMAVEFIRKQAKLNRVTSRLHIVQAAVSDQVGWQPMVAVGVLSGGYYVPPSEDHTAGELTSTRTTTLDQLVQKFGLQPTHVKIDVEGYEFGVISGGHKILSQDDAPILFVELHNEMVRQNGGLPEKTLSLLRNLGYQIFGTNGDPLDDQAILDWPLIRVVARKMPVPAGVAGPPIPIKSVNSE